MTGAAGGRVTCTVDVGSTRIKATLWRGTDDALAMSAMPYPSRHRSLDGADHDAVLSTFAAVVRDVCAVEEPDAIGVTAQMAGLSLLDSEGRPVGPLLSGVHRRIPRHGMPATLVASGCADPASTTLAKYLWCRQVVPELVSNIGGVGGIKEYLLHALTGRWVTDRASASASGFYDLSAENWSAAALRIAGLSVEQLPELAEIDSVVGTVQAGAAAECGLPIGTPVLAGLGDGPAGNIAVEAVGAEIMCLSHGTTVVARLLVRGKLPTVPLPTFVQHVTGKWRCVGVRFTVDERSGALTPTGGLMEKIFPADLESYLQPMLDAFGVVEVRSMGGRPLQLPTAWRVRPVARADGGRALALIANGANLDSFDFPTGRRLRGIV